MCGVRLGALDRLLIMPPRPSRSELRAMQERLDAARERARDELIASAAAVVIAGVAAYFIVRGANGKVKRVRRVRPSRRERIISAPEQRPRKQVESRIVSKKHAS